MRQRGRNIFQQMMAGFLLLIGMSLLQAADMAPVQRWVQGSWINVRQDALADSPVIDHLSTNTEVGLLSVNGKSCLVTWGPAPERRGFVACRLLGEAPVNFEKISRRWEGNGESADYAPAKAFWMKPSLSRLLEAGEDFQGRFMPVPEAKIREGGFSEETPRLVRYPIPEFEAMKARLKQGVVPTEEQRPLMVPLNVVLKRLAKSGEVYDTPLAEIQIYTSKLVLAQLQAVKLPPARPSLFKNFTDFSPPGSSVENIAAQFSAPEQAGFKGGMHWICSRVQDGCFFTGVWDIGSYTVQLQKPVYLQAIDRRGLMAVMEYPGVYQYNYTAEDYEETCRDDLLTGGPAGIFKGGNREARLLPGYPRLKSPLFWFFTPAPLSMKTVKLRSYEVKANGARLSPLPDVAVYEVDIDGDKAADFVLINGALGGDIVMAGWFHLLLANVGGEWILASSGEDIDCT
jgi:hypothetical protein